MTVTDAWLGGRQFEGMSGLAGGGIEDKHSTDVGSPPPPARVYVK
jgi:hypothetical protein